jgi:hypothetical protein
MACKLMMELMLIKYTNGSLQTKELKPSISIEIASISKAPVESVLIYLLLEQRNTIT